LRGTGAAFAKAFEIPCSRIQKQHINGILHLNKETKVMHKGKHNLKIAELTVSDPD
jgi:hypothetical protein